MMKDAGELERENAALRDRLSRLSQASLRRVRSQPSVFRKRRGSSTGLASAIGRNGEGSEEAEP